MTLPTELVFDGVDIAFLGTFLFHNPTVELVRDQALFSSNEAIPDASIVLASEHSLVEALTNDEILNATIPCHLRSGVGPETATFVSIERVGSVEPPLFQLAVGIPDHEEAAHQMLQAIQGMLRHRHVLDSCFEQGVDARIAVESAAADSYGGALAHARLSSIADLIRLLRDGLVKSS